MAVKITLTDDHPLATQGIVAMLKKRKDFKIVDIFHNAKDLFEGLSRQQPEILLLDVMLPDRNGRDVAPEVKQLYPGIKIIALTSFDAPTIVSAMMRRGCSGFLLKDTDAATLIEAIDKVAAGVEFIEPKIQRRIMENVMNFKTESTDASPPMLTQREKEILKLIAAEYTTQEIADELFISFRTVENHRYSLLHKFGVKNSIGLVKIAIQYGLA